MTRSVEGRCHPINGRQDAVADSWLEAGEQLRKYQQQGCGAGVRPQEADRQRAAQEPAVRGLASRFLPQLGGTGFASRSPGSSPTARGSRPGLLPHRTGTDVPDPKEKGEETAATRRKNQ